MMRKFRIINSLGQELDVNKTELFLFEPKNLGFGYDNELQQIGDRFLLVSRKLKKNNPAFKILFDGEEPYDQYKEFITFIQHSPIELVYSPTYDKKYSKKVLIDNVDKGEKNIYGALEISVNTVSLTPWYKVIFSSSNISDNEDKEGWIFPVKFPVKFKDTKTGQVYIESDSNMISKSKVIIYGPINNPSWIHYVNDKLYSEGSVKCNIQADQHLIIDNLSIQPSICIFNSNGEMIQDVYNLSNFNQKRFIDIQNGGNLIHVTTSGEVTIEMETHIYYESV